MTTTQANSVVLGNASADRAAVGVNSVNINGTTYTFAGGAPLGVVSVGAAGAERQVINVAAGQISATSTDAVNGSQLYATNQAISGVKDYVGQEVNRLDRRIDRNDSRASAGVAAAIAVASMPQASLPGEHMVSMGGGVWRGESGYALGISTATKSGKWVFKGSATGSVRSSRPSRSPTLWRARPVSDFGRRRPATYNPD